MQTTTYTDNDGTIVTSFVTEGDNGFEKVSQTITMPGGTTVACPPNNETKSGKSDFYVSYSYDFDNTAICIPGSDGVSVPFFILKGDHRQAYADIIDKYGDFALGECFRYFGQHAMDVDYKATQIYYFNGLGVGCKLLQAGN